jgi:hypothetical protein
MVFSYYYIKHFAPIFTLFVFICLVLSSCGSDDDNENSNQGESTIVDGVNVTKGKKIKELTTFNKENEVLNRYSVEYDSKGRLSCIKVNGSDLAKINYDSRLMAIYLNDYWAGDRLFRFVFSLNTDGYISSIGNSFLVYDSNGYLVRVDESFDCYGELEYNNNDLIKALISKDYKKIFYITYFGKNGNEGDLYVHVNGPNIQNYSSNYHYRYSQDNKNAVCLIALMSGLFGKVPHPQSVLQFKDEKEASAFFEYDANDVEYNRDIRISFVYE